MGVNAVKIIMASLCKGPGLGSRNLTNHSPRSYMITSLSDAGENIESIMERSGHRSSKGVQSYLRGTLKNALNQQRALTAVGEEKLEILKQNDLKSNDDKKPAIYAEPSQKETQVSPTFNITFHVSDGCSTFNMAGK